MSRLLSSRTGTTSKGPLIGTRQRLGRLTRNAAPVPPVVVAFAVIVPVNVVDVRYDIHEHQPEQHERGANHLVIFQLLNSNFSPNQKNKQGKAQKQKLKNSWRSLGGKIKGKQVDVEMCGKELSEKHSSTFWQRSLC